RAGAWASAAAVAVALVFALMPHAVSAPEVTPAVEEQLVASALGPDASTSASTPAAASAGGEMTPETFGAAPAPPRAVAPPPAAPAPSVAVAPRPAAAPMVVQAPVAAPRAPAAPRTPALRAPSPDAPIRSTPVSRTTVSDPTTTLASADVTPAAADGAWDAPANVRVLSLRLQALGRGTADLGWDAPAEAFGAPAPSTRSTPGLRSVRESVPAARARLLTVPGDR
ncbi:MAG TPA: hypothetical protein VGB53_09675, partial [Rubricoccaceae bacterium]